MDRYPHKLYVSNTGGDSTQDADGNWIESAPAFELAGICREEANGSGRTIALTDGVAFLYSSHIYMPELTSPIEAESKIRVEDENGNVRFEGKVARLSIDRKNVRIWA